MKMAFTKRAEAEDVTVVKGEDEVLVRCERCKRMIPKGKPCPHCDAASGGKED